MSLINSLNKYGNALHSAPLLQLASTGVTIHAQRHGKVLSGIEGALSCLSTGVTAPIWLIKDLALTAIAGTSICGKSSRSFVNQGVVNMGIDVLSPFASLAGMGYSFSPFPQRFNAKLPSFLASTDALSTKFNTDFNKLASKVGGSDNIMKLLQWIEKNPKLTVEFAEEVPELKPFAKLLHSIASTLHSIIIEISDKDKLAALVQKLESVNTAPFVGIALAASKSSLSLHGKTLSKIDSALTFAATALSSLAHIVTNLFLVIIALPCALVSKKARAFLITQRCKLKLNIQCFAVACAGTVNPSFGARWMNEKMNKVLPKGLLGLIQESMTHVKGNLEETINHGKATIEFIVTAIEERKVLQLNKFISLAIRKMNESPQNAETIREVLQLFPATSQLFPKELLAPRILTFMDQHTTAVQEIIQLSLEGMPAADVVAKIKAKNPELKKDFIALVPKVLKESPEVVETALQYAMTSPIVQELLPKRIAAEILPLVPQFIQLNKTHPEVVQKAITEAIENKIPHQETLAQLSHNNPALADLIKKLGLS